MALSLLFTDGFDICDGFSGALKYFTNNVFNQPGIVSGYRSIGALRISAAGMTYSKTVGAQPVMLWGAHVQVSAYAQQTFLIIGTASGPQPLLQLQINTDGTLSLLDHAGSLLGRSTPALANATWYWLEVNAVYGTSGSYEVWLGLAGSVPTKVIFGTANLTSAIPDTFTIQWTNPGTNPFMVIDNLQVWAAGALSDRNGPAVVNGLIASKISSTGGWTFAGSKGTSLLQAIADDFGAYSATPDGSFSYDLPGVGTLAALVADPSCFGLVIGLSLNVCAAPISGPVSMTLTANERAGPYVIGVEGVVFNHNIFGQSWLDGYATYQAQATLNGESSNWNDLQIATTQWGIQAAQVYVTQVYVEKVVDITGRKYGCGESSYSF